MHVEAVRIAVSHLWCVCPAKSAEMLGRLGLGSPALDVRFDFLPVGAKVRAGDPLFPRMEAPAAPAPEETRGSGSPRWIAPVLITLAVVAAALVGWFLAGRNDSAKGTVAVPNVLSLRREEAATRIERAGLSVSVREEPSDAFGAGIVFQQSPTGGKRVGENSVVVITVSTGATTTTSSSTTSTSTTSSTTSSTSSTTTTTTTVAPTTTTTVVSTTSVP